MRIDQSYVNAAILLLVGVFITALSLEGFMIKERGEKVFGVISEIIAPDKCKAKGNFIEVEIKGNRYRTPITRGCCLSSCYEKGGQIEFYYNETTGQKIRSDSYIVLPFTVGVLSVLAAVLSIKFKN